MNISGLILTTLFSLCVTGWGRIVNISSVHGLVGSVNKSAYVAAKHGIAGLTKVVTLQAIIQCFPQPNFRHIYGGASAHIKGFGSALIPLQRKIITRGI